METSKKSVAEKLRLIVDKIRGNNVLDAGAKALLGLAPPPLGNFLVNLYENASGSEEDKTKQVIQILENLQKFSQEQFDNLEDIIMKNGEEIKSNTNSLSQLLEITGSVSNKLDEIEDLFNKLREQGATETEQIRGKIDKLESNIFVEFEKLGIPKFDYKITAERLLFYFKLKYFLDNAHKIFIEQNKIARNTHNQIVKKGYNVTTDKKGLDEALSNLHKNSVMDKDDLKNFDFIRRVTDDTERFNWYAKELLMKNEDFMGDSNLLAKLKVHLSTWQAKYQLFKDDPDMCLIYVGPDQSAPFPAGLDDYIITRLKQLKVETKLEI